ncbi:hypothetical protein [Aeromonas hydrophila]|uniref:hypothetical protein n=1 Tax=Aeromonas hydrophila TaxID=644 RepID=UPI002169DCB6|nr:hypothetical protein [Aeromonas hydrophila]MCS3793792.1 hypothetical protein [Aeromonas hydrophila]
MAERIGYAVYSEIEGGYLATASPSNYLWDPSAAMMYETAAKAWASANRRGSKYAVAVAIVRDESGKLQHEELPFPMKAAPGSWIVRIEDTGLPMGPLYVTSLSRDGKTRASTEICDARGFSHEQALELAAQLQSMPNRTAKVEQVSV